MQHLYITSDIATVICRSCGKNEKLRLQALLLVKNGLSPAKFAEGFFGPPFNGSSLDEAS